VPEFLEVNIDRWPCYVFQLGLFGFAKTAVSFILNPLEEAVGQDSQAKRRCMGSTFLTNRLQS
jgi:hypothetical protein